MDLNNNDNIKMEIEELKKYFPYKENVGFNELILNDIGIYSISKPPEAQIITNFIIHVIESCGLGDPKNLSIADATAGFGGNVINFSENFKKVVAIEKNFKNFEILKHNVNVFNLDNVELISGSFLKFIPEKCQDILFFDPPWGGKKYRYKNHIMLYLDNTPIYDIINQIPNKTKIIAVKIPYNFDYGNFINKLYPNQSIINKKIKNYNLLIIHRLSN
jgi:16S rRNA G966 N2-methylase RsmD